MRKVLTALMVLSLSLCLMGCHAPKKFKLKHLIPFTTLEHKFEIEPRTYS